MFPWKFLLPDTKGFKALLILAVFFVVLGIFVAVVIPLFVRAKLTFAPALDYGFLDTVFNLSGLCITIAGFIFAGAGFIYAGYEMQQTLKALENPRLKIILVSSSLDLAGIVVEGTIVLGDFTHSLTEAIPGREGLWYEEFMMWLDVDGDTSARNLYVSIYPTEWHWQLDEGRTTTILTFKPIEAADYTLEWRDPDYVKGWKPGAEWQLINEPPPDVIVIPNLKKYMGKFRVEVKAKTRQGGNLPPDLEIDTLHIDAFADQVRPAKATLKIKLG